MKQLASQLAALQKFVLRESATVAGVAGTRRLSRGKRLGIYRDAYFLRLHELLSSSYAALKTILGDARFDEAVAAYTARYRSHHFSLRHYGGKLATLLAHDARFRNEPALAEVARWEWAMAHAFDAADAVPVNMAALAAVPPRCWADVKIRFHPSLQTLTARWNSVALWQAANRAAQLPPAARESEPRTWVVWRRELAVMFERLDAHERAALRIARRARPFAVICACAPDSLPAPAQAAWAVQLIQRWVARGWIIRLVTS